MKTNDLCYFTDKLLKINKLAKIFPYGHAHTVHGGGARMESEKPRYVRSKTLPLLNMVKHPG